MPGIAARGDSSRCVRERLSQIRELYGTEVEAVETELARAVRSGAAPGTNAAAHLLEAGGKRVRPLTVLLSATCFGKIDAAVLTMAVVSELVHLATLLHDDVIDEGVERRGKPCARTIWGNAMSVLSGDMLLTQALERTASSGPPEVLRELFATLRKLVDGEILQLAGRASLDVDEATYFRSCGARRRHCSNGPLAPAPRARGRRPRAATSWGSSAREWGSPSSSSTMPSTTAVTRVPRESRSSPT